MRVGWNANKKEAHNIIRAVEALPESQRIAAFMIHGRSRLQRYAKLADWEYINEVAAGTANLRPDAQQRGGGGNRAITKHAAAAAAAEGDDAEAEAASTTSIEPFEPPRTPIIGNGDIFSYAQYEANRAHGGGLESCCMLARGALIKPWLPTEIKERRHWDIRSVCVFVCFLSCFSRIRNSLLFSLNYISLFLHFSFPLIFLFDSATERLDMLKDFVRFGLEHWGSDQKGVDNVRRFLLEWMSFLHRYIPVGILEYLDPPPMMNDRPPPFCGRSDLETLLASKDSRDWVKISEMLLGPVPDGYHFIPKHKANSYATPSSIAEAEG